MVIRSWRCRAHSLDKVGSAKGGHLGQKRLALVYLSTKFHPHACGQILDSRSFPLSLRTPETDFRRGSYGRPKMAQPSSFPTELDQKSPAKGGQLGLTQLIPAELGHTQLIPAELGHTQLILAELGQKSLALRKEVSSAKRAQLCAKRSTRPEELSSAQRGQLGQKRSALPKELNSSSQRGQVI